MVETLERHVDLGEVKFPGHLEDTLATIAENPDKPWCFTYNIIYEYNPENPGRISGPPEKCEPPEPEDVSEIGIAGFDEAIRPLLMGWANAMSLNDLSLCLKAVKYHEEQYVDSPKFLQDVIADIERKYGH